MPSISKLINWAIEQCDNPNCGYSLNGRDSYAYYSGSGLYYFDCSSFVNYALIAGGWDLEGKTGYGFGYAFSTNEEPNVMKLLGWENIGASPEYVSPGDIGHIYGSERNTVYGHTEICYEGGSANTAKWMGAHGSTGSYADDFAKQVSCEGTKTWARIFHWYGEDSETGTSGDIPTYDISMEVVAGICGNWWYESTGINPARWELTAKEKQWTSLNEGYGMGGWTNVLGDRYGSLYQLSRYLESNNYAYTSGIGQTEFFLYQNAWNTYNWWQKFDGYSSLTDYLHSSETDIETLVTIFCYCWEGISDYAESWDIGLSQRIEYGKRAYEYIKEHYNDESITSWVARDDYLTDSEALNNAVLLYRTLMNHAQNLPSNKNGSVSTGNNEIKDAQAGDAGYNYEYTDAIYGYVDPVTLSYDDLLTLAFGNLSNSEKQAIISIHKKPKGMR